MGGPGGARLASTYAGRLLEGRYCALHAAAVLRRQGGQVIDVDAGNVPGDGAYAQGPRVQVCGHSVPLPDLVVLHNGRLFFLEVKRRRIRMQGNEGLVGLKEGQLANYRRLHLWGAVPVYILVFGFGGTPYDGAWLARVVALGEPVLTTDNGGGELRHFSLAAGWLNVTATFGPGPQVSLQ
jgi:hypothetical protein